MPRIPKNMNREAWLATAVELLRPEFKRLGHELPADIAISCGFPSKSAMGRKTQRIGECWHHEACDSGTRHIFVSPVLDNPITVLGVVVHELVHAAGFMDHKSGFRKLAVALGLEGKMTATTVGPELAEMLAVVAKKLGPYPHSKIKATRGKVQSTRMLKVECVECGCVVRMTRKWLDECGAPTCACGGEMGEAF